MKPFTLLYTDPVLQAKFDRKKTPFYSLAFQIILIVCILDWLATGITCLVYEKIVLGTIKILIASFCAVLFTMSKKRQFLAKFCIPIVIISYIVSNFESAFSDSSFPFVSKTTKPSNDVPNTYMLSQTFALFTSALIACPISWYYQAICLLFLQLYYMIHLSISFQMVPFIHAWVLGLFLQISILYGSERSRKTQFMDSYLSKQKAKQFKHIIEDYLPNRAVVLSKSLNEILFYNKAFSKFLSTITKTSDQLFEELNKLKTKTGSLIYSTRRVYEGNEAAFSGLIDILLERIQLSPDLSTLEHGHVIKVRNFTLSDFFHSEDPKRTPFDINVVPISWHGTNAYLLLINDVTENMQINRLRLEQIFKDRFLASLSHELRTPLNCMLGFISVLRQSLNKPQDLEALDTIHNSAKVLLISIDSLLDVMSFEKDHKLKLKIKPLKIWTLMQELQSLIQPYLQNKKIKFILNISNELPEIVHIDEERVREVLLHLLLNAVKFTYEGHISLGVEVCPEDKDMLLFHVEDTGIGIKPQDIPGLFRINVERDANIYSKGIGLGLTVSQKLAKILGKWNSPHSGIKVESEYGKGSKFSIAVCNIREDRRTMEAVLSSRARYNSILDVMTRDKVDLSFQSDVKVPSERGNYDKRIRVFKTHESIEFGKQEYSENIRGSSSLTSPQYREQNGSNSNSIKVGKICSDNEMKSEQIHLKSFKSDPSLISEKAEKNEIPNLNGGELSPRGAHNGGSKYTPEKLSKFSFTNKADTTNKGKILVVDDCNFNQLIAIKFLEDLGYTVKTASNGKEAIEMVERANSDPNDLYKIIFMDCQMPIMDGYEATQILKEKMMKNQISLTPIVAITANKNEKDIEKCFESGMDGYLAKPITKDILKNQIKELLPDV